MACVIFVAVCFLALKSCGLAGRSDDCAILNTSNVLAPDGKHEAVVTDQACAFGFGQGGEYIRIFVGRAGQVDSTNGREVFIAHFRPEVVWSDSNELTITVNTLSWIGTSLHQAGEVKIIYRVADRLSEEHMRKDLAEWEQRQLNDLDARSSLTPEQRRAPLANIQFVKRAQLDAYARFKEWAKQNAQQLPNGANP
jgi:hypothetical protein